MKSSPVLAGYREEVSAATWISEIRTASIDATWSDWARSKMTARIAGRLMVTTSADVVADDGLCSLREAIEAADTDTGSGASAGECPAGSGADVITFSVEGPFAGGHVIDSELAVLGVAGVVIDGGGSGSVFEVSASGDATFDSVTITNGSNFSTGGGGIYNTGTVVVSNSTISDNFDAMDLECLDVRGDRIALIRFAASASRPVANEQHAIIVIEVDEAGKICGNFSFDTEQLDEARALPDEVAAEAGSTPPLTGAARWTESGSSAGLGDGE